MQPIVSIISRPRIMGLVCAAAATVLGLTYMLTAGAPTSYLLVNMAALAIGCALMLAIVFTVRKFDSHADIAVVAIGLLLLATALFGSVVEGASRWVTVGNFFIQPSLIALPLAAILFAQTRGTMGLSGIALVILAMTLQPDRAMAGAIFVALLTLVCIQSERRIAMAAILAGFGFFITMMRPDTLPAVPFVDQIFYTSFAVHPMAGLAVLSGAILLAVPAITGFLTDPENRSTYAIFGTAWLTIAGAAALGNYPTPIVGYGGSAIIGYVLCLAALPKRPAVSAKSKKETDCTKPGDAKENAMRITTQPV